MRLKEIITESKLNEYGSQYSDYQKVNAKDVKTAKNNFISNFKQQVKLNKKAGSRPEVIGRLASSYMKKYGVSDAAIQDKRFQDLIQKASAETGFLKPALNELIDYMYFLASTTVQTDANDYNTQQGQSATNSNSGRSVTASNQYTPSTKQIIKRINKYSGEDKLDDLVKIAKTAMQTLYAQDPVKYKALYNEIVSSSNQQTTSPGANAFGQMANQLATQDTQPTPAEIQQQKVAQAGQVARAQMGRR